MRVHSPGEMIEILHVIAYYADLLFPACIAGNAGFNLLV